MKQFDFSNSPETIAAWDQLLLNHPRGLYNQYSDWVKAYESYGFKTGMVFLKDHNRLVGGAGYVIAQFLFFKFIIVPCGPVLLPEYTADLDEFIRVLHQQAKKEGCCYFQISVPSTPNSIGDYRFNFEKLPESSFYYEGIQGTRFKYVIPLYGMRPIILEGKSFDEVRKGYSKNHWRNVQKGIKNDLAFRWIQNQEWDVLREAYACFEQNAKEKGYPIRSYETVQSTLQTYIQKGFAKVGVATYESRIVGALYVMVCGQRYIYINGGVEATFQDKGVSHFMHDWVMGEAHALGHPHYDISVGGSAGVLRFKEGFGSTLIEFEPPRYWVLNRTVFGLYQLVESGLKRQKSKVAKILFLLKKKK
ncbi:MAG: hypothetical protein RL607_550 [Bacteroidota bacterium]